MHALTKRLIWVAAISTLVFPALGMAQISVDRVILNFRKGAPAYRNVVVSNSGKEPLYVSIVADKMVRPGFADERREPTDEVVVSPRRFSVDAEGQRTIRILLKSPLDNTEHVYRLKLLPQATEFDPDELSKKGGKETMLKVLFSVGLLLFADPVEPRADLKWERSDSAINFSNQGNVNVLMEEIQHCKQPDTDCEKAPSQRLYPGNTWELKVPASQLVTFRRQVGDEYQDVRIAPLGQ